VSSGNQQEDKIWHFPSPNEENTEVVGGLLTGILVMISVKLPSRFSQISVTAALVISGDIHPEGNAP